MYTLWIGFFVLVLTLLALDLGVLNKGTKEVGVKEAIGWTFVWIAIAMIFNVAIYFMYEHHWMGIGKVIGHELDGKQAALQYLTGYVIEKSLSLDNIFVIAVIFEYFGVPKVYQRRTLFYGVLGALVLRCAMITGGAALITRLDWMIYVFGGLLILTAGKLLFQKEGHVDPDKNPLVKIARKLFPVTDHFHEEKFFVKVDGKKAITPLFLVLLVIESSDVIFAVDSIPAIFAVTLDPFIVFTSNVFAILGLRSLYFALSAIMGMFKYLKYSLVIVLAFVGVKMLASHFIHIPVSISLLVIVGMLGAGILVSVLAEKRERIADQRDDLSNMR